MSPTSTTGFHGDPIQEGNGNSHDDTSSHHQENEPAPVHTTACTSVGAALQFLSTNLPALLSLSLFSYGGQFLRWTCEQVFDATTTSSGTDSDTGGAFFTDLPANVMGCFLMGLLVAGDATQAKVVAVDLPMACLGRSNPFQRWKMTHLGLRTGFCGALGTFASWNTQMVIMLCGGKGTELGYSQWVSVLWGYLVGWMIAIESFRLGRDCAHAWSRHNNPDLAKEADVIQEKEELGEVVHVNRKLPDFERRFLHDIMIRDADDNDEQEELVSIPPQQQQPTTLENGSNSNNKGDANNPRKLFRRKSSLTDDYGSVNFSLMRTTSQRGLFPKRHKTINLKRYGDDGYHEKYHEHVYLLQQWKDSTESHRTPGSRYAQELHEIEVALLVRHQELCRQDLLQIIREAGWNYGALKSWHELVNNNDDVDKEQAEKGEKMYANAGELLLHLLAFISTTGLLIWGAFHFDDESDHPNYRPPFLAALLSPSGTILRWLLSKCNGTIKRWEWLPIGTLAANLLACVISVLMSAISLHADGTIPPLAAAWMTAIKSGFAGSLSTVSTFAAETVGLFRALPRYFWGYYYSFGSIVVAAIVGVAAYVWAIA